MTPATPGFRRDAAVVGGVRLAYALGGDPAGPPVLLWHGFLGTHRVWRRVAPALAERGYAVLAPDMRGFGDSDKPPGDAYDGLTLARDFRGLVQAIGFGAGRPSRSPRTTWGPRRRCSGPRSTRARSAASST